MFYDIAESGKRIKELRKRRGLSQEQLGKLVGLTQQGRANLESGRKGTRIDTLIIVANFFDASLDYLVLGRINNEINISIPADKKEKAIKLLNAIIEII